MPLPSGSRLLGSLGLRSSSAWADSWLPKLAQSYWSVCAKVGVVGLASSSQATLRVTPLASTRATINNLSAIEAHFSSVKLMAYRVPRWCARGPSSAQSVVDPSHEPRFRAPGADVPPSGVFPLRIGR